MIIITHNEEFSIFNSGAYSSNEFAEFIVNGNSQPLMELIQTTKQNNPNAIGFVDQLPMTEKNNNQSINFYINQSIKKYILFRYTIFIICSKNRR